MANLLNILHPWSNIEIEIHPSDLYEFCIIFLNPYLLILNLRKSWKCIAVGNLDVNVMGLTHAAKHVL